MTPKEQQAVPSEGDARRRAILSEGAAYALVAVAALLIVAWAMQLWRADLRVPLQYSADALITEAGVKSFTENLSYLHNPRLGMPDGQDLRDFPNADSLHFALIGLLAAVSGGWATGLDLYFLLGFPLAALTALWVLRRLGVSRPMSASLGLLYAFLPYHFFRGIAHLFLGAYYLVPLALFISLESVRRPLLYAPEVDGTPAEGRRRFLPSLRAPHAVMALVTCLLVGSGGVYYAYFTCFFLAAAAAYAFLRYRDRLRVASAAILIGVIVLAGAANLASTIAYRFSAPPNPDGPKRNPGYAEVYGLKVDQLFLPADDHRLGPLAAVKALYRKGLTEMGPYMNNESASASLGIVGSLGFLALVLWILRAYTRGPDGEDEAAGALRRMSVMTVLGVLFATVGGFGAIVAVVLPQIRSYNRISVFLALMAFAAVGILLDRVLVQRAGRLAPIASSVLALALLAFGILDQVAPSVVPAYAETTAAWRADAEFVGLVERTLPKGTAVFQLPYMRFPEPGGAVEEMQEYDHLRGYLHSDSLRWSYGAMKGRETDVWQRETAALPVPEFVKEIRAEGFGAVWVDRTGFADRGAALEAELSRLSPRPPVLSRDGRYAVYEL